MIVTSLILRGLMAPLFLSGIFMALQPPAEPCEMHVKDGPNTLLWSCKPKINDPCTSCDVNGVCRQLVFDLGNDLVHECLCIDAVGGKTKRDECYSRVTVDLSTGVVSIDCLNECCLFNCPPAAGPYPAWTDPCTCGG